MIEERLPAFTPCTVDAVEGRGLSEPGFAAAFAAHPNLGESELRLYAVLDAAMVTNLPEMLGASGLPHCCLVRGKAFDALSTVAPWLVELQPNARFVQNLFTQSDVPWHFWGRHGGLFLQTAQSLDALATHLRRFTRVEMQDARWMYVRFWERIVQDSLIAALEDGHSTPSRFLLGRAPGDDLSLITQDFTRRISLLPMSDADRAAHLNVSPAQMIDTLVPYMEQFKLRQDMNMTALKIANAQSTPALISALEDRLLTLHGAGFRNLMQLEELGRIEFNSGFRFLSDPYVHGIVLAGSCGYRHFVDLTDWASKQGYMHDTA